MSKCLQRPILARITYSTILETTIEPCAARSGDIGSHLDEVEAARKSEAANDGELWVHLSKIKVAFWGI